MPVRSAGSRSCIESVMPVLAPAGPSEAPLMPIARWKRPRASGEAISTLTLIEPAERPNTVTLPGSPPNALDVLGEPLSARIWSWIP